MLKEQDTKWQREADNLILEGETEGRKLEACHVEEKDCMKKRPEETSDV